MPLIDRIFNPPSLVVINLLIIIVVEFTGNGKFFFETGLIHAVAILFIALTTSRIFYHYYTYDPIFEKFVHSALAASVIFASSHIFEYISMVVFSHYTDAIFANVINFYLIGFILIIIGAESFLRIVASRSTYLIKLFAVAIAVFSGLIILFALNNELISLEPSGLAPFVYAFLIGVFSFLGIYIVFKIKKTVPISAAFSNYLLSSIILIIISTLPYVFYEFIKEELYGYIKEYQIIYFSHFAFFAALSLLFLAFTKLKWGGLYEETRKFVESNNK